MAFLLIPAVALGVVALARKRPAQPTQQQAPAPQGTDTPYYAQVVNANLSVEEAVRRPAVGSAGGRAPAVRCTQINVAFIGVPKMGKSAVLNALACCSAGMQQTIVVESALSHGGNTTLRFTRIPLLEVALANAGRTPQPGFDFVVFDMVGMRDDRELIATMQGKLRDNQAWPMPPQGIPQLSAQQVADLVRVEGERRAIETPVRPLSALDSAQCAVLFITADALIAGAGTAANSIKMLDVCQNFNCNAEFPIQLPRLLVVTQVDLWHAANPPSPASLLHGESGALAPLYVAARDQLGLSAPDVIPLGWLGRSDASSIDYASPTDPRVIALKYLAQRASMLACTTLRLHFSELLAAGAPA
jgi:hypothetical protein